MQTLHQNHSSSAGNIACGEGVKLTLSPVIVPFAPLHFCVKAELDKGGKPGRLEQAGPQGKRVKWGKCARRFTGPR